MQCSLIFFAVLQCSEPPHVPLLKVLRIVDFRRVICIFIPKQARATHLHMGVGLGISADYRTGSTPSSGKKPNTFTGHWSREQTVQGENKASEKSKSKPDQQSPKRIGN